MIIDLAWPIKLLRHIRLALLAIGLISLVAQTAVAQTDESKNAPQFTEQQLEFFETKVRPLLVEKCYDCHGPDSTPIEGSLSLASRKSILAGGDTGPAIVPGHPDKSLLIDAINYGEVYEMPPDTKMSDDEIAILTDWVKQKAPWPKSSDSEVETKSDFDLEARKAAHWSWQPIRKPAIPKVENEAWPKDPIDNFILAGVESAGLTPAQPADRRTLIRRAYFDIIGLPPTPDQVTAFVDDQSPRAFEKVVDGLLASPQFGERWARHWMDLSRYAESGGHEFDYEIQNAFRYRDYLIRAFNSDVPYKQFVQEHIAGDLLDDPRRNPAEQFNESILGTGFWFLGEAKHSPVDSKEEEARTVDNQIDVMSKTFLGMTVACARCHDHKFDAISTEDYYALSGFLQSSRRQSAMLDPGRKIEKSFDAASRLVGQGNKLVKQLVSKLKTADETKIASYVNASLVFLRSDPDWNRAAPTLIEGELLKQISVSGGETLEQTIKKREGLEWSGEKQYWWKHGSVGDEWVLEFEVLGGIEDFEVYAVFTKASDYGAAKILINDVVVKEQVDFFDQVLGTTRLKFGQLKLKPGKNQLKFVLAEPNKDAAPSRMVGIDYLELTPVSQHSESEIASIKTLAADRELDEDLLKKLITAFQDPSIQNKNHPLNLIYQVSLQARPIDSTLSDELAKREENRQSQFEKWQEQTTLFSDFKKGLPDGWFRTGLAFGTESQTEASTDLSASGRLLRRADTVHSGQYGSNFYGVIRSPTFELTHSHIHYRCRGRNVTIRLIIDGYVMDEFNPLLFVGCRVNIGDSDDFHWVTQSGDIKNHIGSRAHIEIIDHGDGFVELNEIRFSNGAHPVNPAGELDGKLATDGFDSQDSFVESVANTIKTQLGDITDSANREIASWILENDLAAVFSNSTADKSLSRTGESNFQSVSITTNSEDRSSDAATSPNLSEQMDSVRKQLKELNAKTPAPQLAIAMTEGTGEEEHVFIRGNHKTLGDVATRRFLKAISDRPLNPDNGSGRLLLARKITAPNNPLTTRVAVNRIWHHMLGKGIVASVDNFGVLGKKPTHPELLDYLASEFASDGQSFKQMIKRIALTQTYQMSSRPSEAGSEVDPSNNLLHRARIRRLQGEAIRDAMLSMSGDLDLKMFGPPVPVYLTPFMSGRGRPQKSGPLNGAGRRSVYISVRRNFLSPMMLAFDTPIPFNSIGARNKSNVPAQALILMNDPFVIEQANHWAKRLLETEQTNSQRVETIYLAALGRPPRELELKKALLFIDQQAAEMKLEGDAINTNLELWQDFCHVVFNLKEFIYIQ